MFLLEGSEPNVSQASSSELSILNVNAYDSVGQQFGGYHLHRKLKELGYQSHMAVMYSRLDDPHIHQVSNWITRKVDRRLVSPIEDFLSVKSILPLSAWTLYFSPYYRSADIVHLQLVYSAPFFSLLNLPVMSRRRRIIWTLHDPWMTTGHCIHSLDCDRWLTGCGACPDLTLPFPMKRDTSAFLWKLKHWVMHHSNVTLVVPSQWMYERVQRSPILSHLPCYVIPHGIDLKQFKRRDQVRCRSRFGIPQDAHVLAFRYRGDTERFKGWPWLEKALMLLNVTQPTYLLVFQGKGGMENLKDKYEVIELGWVNDQDLIVEALNAADIFLMPSVAEAFGMMAVESMACGTPVIVFEGTALPDVIHAPHGGIAVPYKDCEALAWAIENLLEDRSLYESLIQEGLRIVRQEYDFDLHVRRHIALYKRLVS